MSYDKIISKPIFLFELDNKLELYFIKIIKKIKKHKKIGGYKDDRNRF